MRVFKGWLWAVVALLVAWLAAFAWGRLRPPSPEQRVALEALHKDTRPRQGRNAYPMFWFGAFDVPPGQLDAAYAKDRARVEAWYQSFDAGAHATPAPQPHADFPVLPQPTSVERKALCSSHDPDCLGKARAHNDALHALLNRHAKLLARDEALTHFDYVWDDMPKGPVAPMAPFDAMMGLWQTSSALDFVDGRQAQGLESVCTQIATLRRLHAHSNTMVGTLILAARLRGGVLLFAQMLSEAPADLAMPPICHAAFAPLTLDDVDLCPGMQSEFSALASPMALGADKRWYEHWHLSRSLTERMLAPGYAPACDAERTKKVLNDDTVSFARQPPSFDVFDKIANSAGVMLTRPSFGDFTSWFVRQQDTAATLRMGALIMWLHEQHGDSRTLPQLLAARPAWMRFGADRAMAPTPDGHGLTMKLRNNPGNEWPITWPLPANP